MPSSPMVSLFDRCFSFASWLLVAMVAFAQLAVADETPADSRQPNVVLIMADDVGWEAFGDYGGEDYRTERLDELCQLGVRFSHCYSTPLCTPSRVQIMTGKYNFRNYTHFGYLDPNEPTFGRLMRDAGYATAIAGKWQLNGLANRLPGFNDNTRPHHFGFDEYLLWQLTKGKNRGSGGGERYWSPVLEHNGNMLTVEQNEHKYGPDMMCEFVCDFMERKRDQPFFVYYPMLLVHDPFVPTPETIGERDRGHDTNRPKPREKQENFAAMVDYMDKIVGRIVDKIDSLGQLENTLIVFTADNGTHRTIESKWNGQTIRGGKGGTTDMGTHVPLIAYWKGRTPAGKVIDDLVDFTDFLPTLAELAGSDTGQTGDRGQLDGRSFLPQLLGQPGNPRQWVLCHYQPWWGPEPGHYARNQVYKLYRDGRYYRIPADLAEADDLAIGTAGEEGEAARRFLTQILDLSPPVPKGRGNKDDHQRTTHPDWPIITITGDR
ncbi:sulfatase-like hydrolase/transferase [Planctomycetaceae bacterium SH139]